jgi:hypothetical protein
MFATVGSGVKLMHPGPFLKMKNKKININKSPSSQAASGWALPLKNQGPSRVDSSSGIL